MPETTSVPRGETSDLAGVTTAATRRTRFRLERFTPRGAANADFATFVVVGEMSPDELLESHRALLDSAPALLALVDLSSAYLGRIEGDTMRRLAGRAAQLGKQRCASGRVAIVCVREVDFGMARMFSMLASLEGHPVRFGVFAGPGEAKAWLAGETEDP